MKKTIMLVLITIITSSLVTGCRCCRWCGSHGDPKPEHPKEHPAE